MAASVPRLQPQVQSWTSSTLDAVVWADILGAEVLPASRAEAMAVPAVARARHLTAGTAASLPLQVLTGATPVAPLPYWCQGSDGQLGDLTAAEADRFAIEAQSTWHRMLNTVDDHLFYGESLWLATSLNAAGRPRTAARVPWDAWDRVYVEETARYTFTDAGGDPIDPARVIYLPGPHEGILNFGQRTIRGATAMEASALDIARRPFRIELHQETDVTLTPAERAELIASTRQALQDNNGILFTNAAVKIVPHAIDSAELLIEGRNASALDVARDVSMPAAMLDATSVGASLEYATLTGRNQQWLDYGLSLYLDAIGARLSMDDVVPPGQRVVFDTSTLTALDRPAAGAPTED
jgi:hypothetical protein